MTRQTRNATAPETAQSDQPVRASLGVAPLGLAATPLLLWLFRSGLDIAAGLAIAAMLGTAFWLLATGLQAQAEYDSRDDAPRPTQPRKLLGAVLLGLAVAALAAFQMPIWPSALLTGLAACVLCLTAFGTDPQRDKRRSPEASDCDDTNREEVDQLLDRMTRETAA